VRLKDARLSLGDAYEFSQYHIESLIVEGHSIVDINSFDGGMTHLFLEDIIVADGSLLNFLGLFSEVESRIFV